MYDEALFLERRAESKENPGCCLDVICSSKNGRFKEALKLYEKSNLKNILKYITIVIFRHNYFSIIIIAII